MKWEQLWKVAIDDAIDKWMQRLKLSVTEDNKCISTKEALTAGMSSLAFDSIEHVQLFNRDMFVALTHGKCALCNKAWAGAVSTHARTHTHTCRYTW